MENLNRCPAEGDFTDEEVKKRLERLISDKNECDRQTVEAFIQRIKSKYNNCGEYRSYYLLCGTEPPRECPYGDFPECDSVRAFVENQVKIVETKKLLGTLYKNDGCDLEKVRTFLCHLRSKYPDYRSYRMYHLMIGSTPPPQCWNVDFPNDDSVQKFVENLARDVEARLRQFAAGRGTL